ncbi:MAG TPA: phosphopantothenoylcysteine decarboxylase [Candidatus Brocadiia bacterium]|nr:phosphopantothenoylcysteine decarboxylase [Candidatus Brocadiia bacterium]
MRFLITTGPTREPIDAIRYISNPSTGRMGFAVAQAALEAGHSAIVIAGPCSATPPPGAELVPVVTTDDMLRAVLERLDEADVLVAAAAPCDFRPAEPTDLKIKKTPDGLTLRLEPTPDILLEAAALKGRRVHIGFALEVQDALASALGKLSRKKLDAIVLNSPAAFGADQSDVVIIHAGGAEEPMSGASKLDIARRLVQLASRLWESKNA